MPLLFHPGDRRAEKPVVYFGWRCVLQPALRERDWKVGPKGLEEAMHGTTIVLLIPARTDTSYFHDYIYGKAEIRFIRGRLRFTDEDGISSGPAPFPSMVAIYNGGQQRGA